MNIENFDNVLSNVKIRGQEHIAACPICESNDSKGHHLYYRQDGDKVLINCKKSNCSFSEIVNAVELKQNATSKNDTWDLLREHYYENENGLVIARKLIYKAADGKKCVWERKENGAYVKGLNGIKIPLYNLPALINSTNEILYIVEGEKDVETLNHLGYIATTSPHGAANTWSASFNKYFLDKQVVLIPDNDEIGWKYADNIATALQDFAESIKIIDLEMLVPELSEKGDISDACNLVGDDETKALIVKALDQSKELKRAKNPNWLIINDDKSSIDEVIFINEFKEEYNLVYINETFYDFNGRIADSKVKSMVQSRIAKHFNKGLAAKEKSILAALKNLCHSVSPEPAPNEIHCINNTLKVFKNKELEINPLQFSLNRLNVKYNPDAPEPIIWKDFLSELLYEDDIPLLQEYLGYCLLPTTIAQKCLCIIGSGGEGKSKIGYICNLIFGDTMINEKVHKLDEDRFIIPQLEQKNLFYDDDLNTSKLKETGVLKNLVTNELHIQGEKKGIDKFRIKPFVRFLMCGNSPLSSCFDKSNGFYRRIIILKCKPKTRTEAQDDHFLSDKLLAEKEGIFLWCLEGLQRLVNNDFNFVLSPRAEQNLQQAKEDDTNIISFINDDYVVKDSQGKIHSKVLLELYKAWCSDNAEVPLADRTFLEYLKKSQEELGIKYSAQIKMNTSGERSRGYEGIKIGTRGKRKLQIN